MIKPLNALGRAVFTVVNAVGLAAYAWALWSVVEWQLTHDAWEYLALFLVALASGLISVKVPDVNSLISVSDAFVFTAVLFFGPTPAALLAATDAFISVRRHSKRLLSAVSSASVMTISILISGAVYRSLLGLFWPGGQGLPEFQQVISPLAAMSLAHWLLNSMLVATLTGLARRRPIWRLWRSNYVWTSASFFAGASAAGLAFLLIRHVGLMAFLICAPILGITFYSYRIYMGRVDEQTRRILEMNKVHLRTIDALATAIEAKGQSAYGHLKRVQALAEALAKAVDADDDTIEGVRAAALLHDIGKLAVPDPVLNKAGPLTPAERAKAQTYPRIGAETVAGVNFPFPVAPFIRHHRERWDGSGYPDGLAGEQIPLGARVIGLADCVLTMLSDRPWRSALPREEMLRFVQSEAGKSFDPRLVELFCARCDELISAAAAVEVTEQQGVAEISTLLREHAALGASTDKSGGVLADIVAARREELVMYDLARDLGAGVDLDGALRAIMNKMRSLITFDAGAIYLLDAQVNALVPVHAEGQFAEALLKNSVARGDGITGWAAANVRGLLNADPQLDFTGEQAEQGQRYRSALVAPLVADELCLGAVTLYDAREQHFSGEDQRVLEMVAPPAAAAIKAACAQRETKDQALTDSLTGLPNKRFLLERLQKELNQAAITGKPLSLVVIDLDRFKPINDLYGHAAGDEVLQAAAQALKRFFRGSDIICRTGGDEFIAVMPEASAEACENAVRRAQAGIDALEVVISSGQTVGVGLSAGWSVHPQDGATIEELLQAADQRMYQDKALRHEQAGVTADRR